MGVPSSVPAGANSLSIVTSANAQLIYHHFKDVQLTASMGPAYPYVSGAAWLAYAPWDTSFYVAVSPSSVDVIQAKNYTTTDVIPVGSSPFGVAVDPQTKEVFVTNSGSNNVTVISGTTQKVVGSIKVGKDPKGIAFDVSNGTLYVSNNGSSTVSVISVASARIVTNVSVGSGPVGNAWDGATDRIFVADGGSNEVSVIDAKSNNAVVATVSVGTRPYGVAIDNATENVYVTNEGSSNISVLSATMMWLNATIPVVGTVGLQGIAYDSLHRWIWVAGGYNFALVVNTSTESVIAYIMVDPEGAVFDPDNGNVCFTNSINSTFTCTVFGGYGFIPPATVTFSETGLPTGITWSVTLGPAYVAGSIENVTQYSSSTSVRFEVPVGWYLPGYYNYSYAIAPTSGYVANPAGGFAFSANGSSLRVSVNFQSSPGPYTVTFSESGLASGTSWSVALGSSTLTSRGFTVSFSVPSGTYPYKIADVPGWHQVTLPYEGRIVVDGRTVTETTLAFLPFIYGLNFIESGLAIGTSWSVTLDGINASSNSATIDFNATNGTHQYTIGVVSGYMTVAFGATTIAGADRSVSIVFTTVFVVTFGETGLPMGFGWSVTLQGTVHHSTTDMLTFLEQNGTYAYSAGADPVSWRFTEIGYIANPASGAMVVSGGPQNQGIVFTPNNPPMTFSVTFAEIGLGLGTGWSVTFNGITRSGSGNIAFMGIPNGTYQITIGAVAGYTVGPYPVRLTVSGVNVTQPVNFSPVSSGSSTPTLLGLPVAEGIGVLGGMLAVIGAAAVVLVLRKRRGKTRPGPEISRAPPNSG